MTSWYLVVSARLIVQEIHADAKKRGTICTSKCHKGSECQNQPGQVAKLKQGSSKRDRKPEVCACMFACTVIFLQLKFKSSVSDFILLHALCSDLDPHY